MTAAPTCPRCGGDLRPPGLWSSDWTCPRDGAVHPHYGVRQVSPQAVTRALELPGVPLWAPHPMPAGWVVSGLSYAGDPRDRLRASMLACSGPAPLGGAGDVAIVAEEPGIGLGSRIAGAGGGVDPEGVAAGPAYAKVDCDGHPTALWTVPAAEDRCAFLGEARGMWLWVVLWPSSADVLLLDDFALTDLRVGGPAAYEMLGYGAWSPRVQSAG